MVRAAQEFKLPLQDFAPNNEISAFWNGSGIVALVRWKLAATKNYFSF
jgi:hypothetical protein